MTSAICICLEEAHIANDGSGDKESMSTFVFLIILFKRKTGKKKEKKKMKAVKII